MMAPAGTPSEVTEKLMKAVGDAVKRPDVNQRLIGLGVEPSFASGARYEKILSAEIPKWSQVIKLANIKID
jgi:tripartite-type tricarboxylate transporter receptor subunit TctC